MKSIEKLREFVDDQFAISGQAYLQGMAIANSIEAEIADNYMRLPVDADGVPIHVGDELETSEHGKRFTCTGYSYQTEGYKKPHWSIAYRYDDYDGTTEFVSLRSCRHVKPRTLENIVADAIQYGHNGITGDRIEGKVAEFCAEIRELLGKAGD